MLTPYKRRPLSHLWISLIAAGIVAALCASAAFCQRSAPPERAKLLPSAVSSWEGYYSVVGYDGADTGELTKYTGICCLKKIKGAYHAAYLNGPVYALGVGQLKDNALSVGWTITVGDLIKARGVTVYHRAGNNLIGSWIALPGSGVVREETLTWRGPIVEDEETVEPPKASSPVTCPCGLSCDCPQCDCGQAKKTLEPKKKAK